MTEEDKKVLTALARRYGYYKVVQGLAENAKEACRTVFADNDEAVVHRDAVSLEVAVEHMKDNHFLRALESAR